MADTFIAGKMYAVKGNRTKSNSVGGADPVAGDAVAYTVGAANITRACDDALAAMAKDVDPITGLDYTGLHEADEIYSISRSPAKAGDPDTLLDNIAAVDTTVYVDCGFNGTVVYPTTSDPSRPAVFPSGERVTFSLKSLLIGTDPQYACWGLVDVAGRPVGYFTSDGAAVPDPQAVTPAEGAYCHIPVVQDAVGVSTMKLVLVAGSDWASMAAGTGAVTTVPDDVRLSEIQIQRGRAVDPWEITLGDIMETDGTHTATYFGKLWGATAAGATNTVLTTAYVKPVLDNDVPVYKVTGAAALDNNEFALFARYPHAKFMTSLADRDGVITKISVQRKWDSDAAMGPESFEYIIEDPATSGTLVWSEDKTAADASQVGRTYYDAATDTSYVKQAFARTGHSGNVEILLKAYGDDDADGNPVVLGEVHFKLDLSGFSTL